MPDKVFKDLTMFAQLRSAVLLFLLLTVLTGVAYPLAMTLIAQTIFAHQANGSQIERDGQAIGSALIGQSFDDPRYFWGRPSATGPMPYNAAASTGSNLGPTNPAQLDAVKQRVENLRTADGDSKSPVPIDLVTASASGLDPHISPEAAEYQVARVAKARSIGEEVVRKLIAENTEGRQLGILGEPGVNVLKLNLALDSAQR
jgi:potassium-transporting ATPase KdpC subunit